MSSTSNEFSTFIGEAIDADNPITKYYDLIRRLGEGAFGLVVLARCKASGELVAIKQAKGKVSKDHEGIPQDVYREIKVSSSSEASPSTFMTVAIDVVAAAAAEAAAAGVAVLFVAVCAVAAIALLLFSAFRTSVRVASSSLPSHSHSLSALPDSSRHAARKRGAAHQGSH